MCYCCVDRRMARLSSLNIWEKTCFCMWSYVGVLKLYLYNLHAYSMYVLACVLYVCVGRFLAVSVYDYSLSPSPHEHLATWVRLVSVSAPHKPPSPPYPLLMTHVSVLLNILFQNVTCSKCHVSEEHIFISRPENTQHFAYIYSIPTQRHTHVRVLVHIHLVTDTHNTGKQSIIGTIQ